MRSLLVILHDICSAMAAWMLAYWLRFNFDVPETYWTGMLVTMPFVVLVQAASFHLFGLYRGIWRFASLPDLKRIIFAISLAALLVPLVLALTNSLSNVPRSILVLQPLILLLMMGAGRFFYRAWRDGLLSFWNNTERTNVLIIGAGQEGANLARELSSRPEWRIVGFVDDDVARKGKRLGGLPVLGGIEDLARVAGSLSLTHAIVAMPSSSIAQRRRATETAINAGLQVLTVPALDDVLTGRISISHVRPVELEDILGREPVLLDGGGLRGWLGEHVVLVTGAGGSIGSELARQVANFKPRLLVLFELSEFALYQLEQEFQEKYPGVATACIVGDVKDIALLDRVFAKYAPSVVFHAAAYKHVPLMEGENAWQAIRNNVFGSRCVAEAAIRHGVEKLVLISTDKAVNPTNVMGASKRLAERLVGSMQNKGKTRFITVRFGNVLGSNGSVIPKFREQIARGGPVTVTHPDIIRYFMLIPEAAQLVLQAGLMGNGGEIFVLEMGEPIKIADLARDMIRLSGFSDDEVKIVFTGLRPGEKLYEELLTDNEQTMATPHPKLRVARAEEAPDSDWENGVNAWLATEEALDSAQVKENLKRFVPEYAPAY